MKTPREILLRRHEAAEPKLDAIRRKVLDAELRPAAVPSLQYLSWLTVPWREVVWPCRRIWAGMAAAWLVILVANVSMRDNSPALARKVLPPSPEIIMALRQQERLLSDLTDPREIQPAKTPTRSAPQPRSERRDELSTSIV